MYAIRSYYVRVAQQAGVARHLGPCGAADQAVERQPGGLAGDVVITSYSIHYTKLYDYLFDTVAHLRELGIRDRRLEALERKVRRLIDTPPEVAASSG